ncbi:DUF1329 domain-containing protein [Endozoicomonas sp. OPT23]|uniref:DUF1329 domain-containing protein n=1 Tax=Endozoicomonas sp. OPT23 TaxID=2072845 RepID=UPI00129A26BE|nr:DUF1329 domain-containing protein [Endozoicomonas sp. OPT23]MRI33831.1 DUF1329 domain-containing protein [Endozoicomonas sp. OPT23]
MSKPKKLSTFKQSVLVVATASLISSAAIAKVSPEQAARLGKDLTPVGAERAGNADGSIPAWTAEFKIPAEYQGSGSRYIDPYADEKPLFTITAENVEQYKDRLSPGQVKMFKTFPDTFRMPVYQSHRAGGYSDFINKNAFENATRAELSDGGNGVKNAFGGTAFPIPNNGEEVIWNMHYAGLPYFSEFTASSGVVYRDGSRQMGRKTTTSRAAYFDPSLTIEEFQEKNYPKIYQVYQSLKPVRNKGESVLVYEPLDAAAMPRSAWSYSPGVRRVRRAPTISYDAPTGVGNFSPTDSGIGFNGATDKYNWKLLGKQELYIPYHNYKFEDPSISYDELLTAGHPNPEHMRYELHRVWVVEANLKESERNVFKKRVVYVDEDSWVPGVVDMYDGRATLWRVTMLNSINRYDMPGITRRTSVYYDLVSREYALDDLFNEEKLDVLNVNAKEYAWFKPSTLRKLGIR